MIGTLSPTEVEAMLARHRVGRIACSANDRPYLVAVNYAYDGTYVYGYSAPGRKIEVMREQPLVCFEVDEIDGPSAWRSVVAEGVFEELTDAEARQAALIRVIGEDSDPVAQGISGSDEIVVFRLRLTEKSGRFERPGA